MRTTMVLACLLVLTMTAPAAQPEPVPGEYYSFSFEPRGYWDFERISMRDGWGSINWSIGLTPDPRPNVFGPTPFGLAFDVDGSMYTTLNILAFEPAQVESQFARVDSSTGEVTLIGDPFPINTAGGDIDACGNYYVTGFEVPALGYIWGDSNLYVIDKQTGEPTLIGDTGKTNWMDLAFDSDGTLWATTENELHTLDTETGLATFITEIHGVPHAEPPDLMEIMSIAFDERGHLYGTAMTVYYEDPDGSPVLKIDTVTGDATVIGYTHQVYNHGGDILPKKATVAHLEGKGEYRCITIALRALPEHLEHGDYVPGTVGHSCTCP